MNSQLFLVLWNWFPITTRFKDAKGPISSNKKSADTPWCDMTIQIGQTSQLDTLNQLL